MISEKQNHCNRFICSGDVIKILSPILANLTSDLRLFSCSISGPLLGKWWGPPGLAAKYLHPKVKREFDI